MTISAPLSPAKVHALTVQGPYFFHLCFLSAQGRAWFILDAQLEINTEINMKFIKANLFFFLMKEIDTLRSKERVLVQLFPIISWEIDGETVEIVSNFIFWGSKITPDGDSRCEIKRRLHLGRKVMTNLDSIFKSRDIALPTKVHLVKTGFSSSHVWM